MGSIPFRSSQTIGLSRLGLLLYISRKDLIAGFDFDHKNLILCFYHKIRFIPPFFPIQVIIQFKLSWRRTQPFLDIFVIFKNHGKNSFRITVKFIQTMTCLMKARKNFAPHFSYRDMSPQIKNLIRLILSAKIRLNP